MRKIRFDAQNADMSSRPELYLDWCSYEAAKFACERWHYSNCLPSSLQKRVAIGVWEDGAFVGVVIFGHGANPQIGTPYGLSIYECCELTRIALSKRHKSPVSRIIRVALSFLRRSQKGIRLVVSYADESQGHHGGVYQATNWVYEGKSKGVDAIAFNGKIWHLKAFRTSFPNAKMSDPRIKKVPQGDKHKYLMPLDDEMRARIAPLAKPYPKRAGSAASGTSDFQSAGDGATPIPALSKLKEAEHG
jgi:hypothetical protein